MVTVREEIRVSTNGVAGWWCIDCFLYVAAVEVIVWTLVKIRMCYKYCIVWYQKDSILLREA